MIIEDNNLIVNLPSSFVSGKWKLESDRGNGEAKLYIGHKKEEERLDDFFENFDVKNEYEFNITKIRDFLLKLYMEYNFELFNSYKKVDKNVFNSVLKQVNKLPNKVSVDLQKFVDKNRYYIRSIEQIDTWNFLMRKLPLPKITNLVVSKKDKNYFELILDVNDYINDNKEEKSLVCDDLEKLDEEPNRIYYGAPGTGKSFTLDMDSKQFGKNIKRVTFHPSMIYGNFVGSYKPIPSEDSNVPITYGYVPGPLINILVQALKNPSEPHLLIIEELNRANTASVFGEFFQLLDRDDNGLSEYPIDISRDLMIYLEKELYENEENEDLLSYIQGTLQNGLVLPGNLYIWATMNSADQGVMPLDAAFKRRWDFKYFGVDDAYDATVFEEYGKINLGEGKKISWDNMRRFINENLSMMDIPEDKLLGPYFISKSILNQSDEKVTNAFINKVIMYLFEDLGVHNRTKIFSVNILRYSNIIREFKENGEEIFNNSIKLEKMIESSSDI